MKQYKLVLSAFVVSTVLLGAARAEHVSGIVFLDVNANGRLDAGEKGVAGVPVTDTLSFVVTDDEGRYVIDAQADPLRRKGSKPLVAISIPSGHWPTKGWFRRIKDVPDASKVHFGLRTDGQKLPFTFVHATDSHVPRGDTADRKLFLEFEKEIQQASDTVKFCILTGDLVNLPDRCTQRRGLADFALFGEYTADFPVPLFCTPGNHDACGIDPKGEPFDKDHKFYGYGAYTHYVGPLRWSFNYAGIHLVGLDFNDLQGQAWKPGTTPEHAIRWLKADLKLAPNSSRVFLFIHNASGLTPYEEAITHCRIERIFDGHGHGLRAGKFAGIPTLMGGSLSQIAGGKMGYRVVEVTDAGVNAPYTVLTVLKKP